MSRGVWAALAGTALLLLGATACSSVGEPRATSTPSSSAAGRASPLPAPSSTYVPSALELQEVARLPSPVWAGAVPGDPASLYVALRSGQVVRIDAVTGARTGTVLDLRGQVATGNEQGLLSMAFDPAYPRVSRIYVDYTDTQGDTQVVAYTVTAGRAVRPTVLLSIAQPYRNNNGGLVLFDRSGMLLVGTGDGGNAGDPDDRAQDPASMLGKLLRIDPRTGRPAAGNPYPENRYVWALGLRNPWRFAFDTNGDLYLGDAGQTTAEEIDVVPPRWQRGANFGWSVYEGDVRFKQDRQFTPGGPLIAPALTYPHADGACLVAVGPVYRGRLHPDLRGALLYGDYCAGRLLAVRRLGLGLGTPLDLAVKAHGLTAFGLDADGEVLVLTPDRVSRLVPGA